MHTIFSEQQLISCSEKGEGFDCETIPSMEPTNSQSKPIINMLKEEVIPFKETTFENISLNREAFHFLNSSTYYSLYPDHFDGCVVQETIQILFKLMIHGQTL
jgi:hypothetical protein